MLLTADWHLVDTPSEDYRWDVFNKMISLSNSTGDKDIYILGDLCDRKDRHSAALVNRVVEGFENLAKAGCEVTVLMGNHDIPISGTPYWNILNSSGRKVSFLWRPDTIYYGKRSVALLPFSAQPEVDWADYIAAEWRGIDMILMHQPVDGALSENGMRYSTPNMLPLPTNIPIYSGDIHTPQVVGNVTYVGAPHVVDFGDMYRCRALQVYANTPKARKYYFHNPHRKWMLRGSSVAEIRAANDVEKGHQAKVEFTLPIENVDKWPGIQEELRTWASDAGFTLVTMEAIVQMGAGKLSEVGLALDSAKATLEAFMREEGVSGKTMRVGLEILAEVERDDG